MGAPMTLFDLAQRGMSSQMVRMNAAASNLANAGSVAGSQDKAYRPLRPVFAEELDTATGLSSVRVDAVRRSDAAPVKHYDPDHPLADAEGNVWLSAVEAERMRAAVEGGEAAGAFLAVDQRRGDGGDEIGRADEMGEMRARLHMRQGRMCCRIGVGDASVPGDDEQGRGELFQQRPARIGRGRRGMRRIPRGVGERHRRAGREAPGDRHGEEDDEPSRQEGGQRRKAQRR